MPTPFMHLYMAERVLADDRVADELSTLLRSELSAFYFGNVAPDFQVIADVKRQETHFYPIPAEIGDYGAFERMQAAYPQFADPAGLSRREAVMTAAYGAHLIYDLVWNHHILAPCFLDQEWGTPLERFTAHVVLLAYLDRVSLRELPESAEGVLEAAVFEGWLPFDGEGKLAEWQELLVAQLRPEGEAQTIEIFASRLRMEPAAFSANLNDPDWMAEHVFQHASLAHVAEVDQLALTKSVALLVDYLRPLF